MRSGHLLKAGHYGEKNQVKISKKKKNIYDVRLSISILGKLYVEIPVIV